MIPNISVSCPDCGKVRLVLRKDSEKVTFTGRCKSCNAYHNLEKLNPLKRENHPRWQGGIHYSRLDGYVVVNLPSDSPFYPMTTRGNRVFEHRLVVAKSLGRCLKPREIVHHLNGIRGDNRLENLIVTNNKSHEKGTLVQLLQARIRILEGRK